MSVREHKAIFERFWSELWNQWRFELIPELLSPEIVFRGSLGVDVRGHEGFREYMETVRQAFPDFHNTIESLIAEGDRAAARLTYRGTHSGPLFGHAPTGRRIEYAGAAFFRIADGKIAEGWVLGDTMALWKQLGMR